MNTVDVTPHAEYACTYASANKDGERAIMLCLVVAGNTYPVSRKTDYAQPESFKMGSVSCFHYQVSNSCCPENLVPSICSVKLGVYVCVCVVYSILYHTIL